MRMTSGLVALALAITLAGGPAAAQQRDLAVPASKGWQHALTGLVLPATIDGLPRTKLVDLTTSEHDIIAEFATSDASLVMTVYLFHPAAGGASLWFERSEAALSARDVYHGVVPAGAAPVAFVPPGGGSVTSALRRTYMPRGGAYRGTGLAIVPLGDWLVAVRLSATALDAAGVDARMDRVLAAIRWPTSVVPAPSAAPIPPCTTPLAFAKARLVKAEGADMLMSLLSGAVAADMAAKGQKPTSLPLCRDASTTQTLGVYGYADAKGYLLALLDAGRAAFITPTLAMQTAHTEGYAISFGNVDGTTTAYGTFDHLPAPAQVASLIEHGARLGTSSGKTVTIDAAALRK